MSKGLRRRRRGQVLVMVTFALIAMTGMLGLVVDLGWSYFVRKSAQAAADTAALAAVRRAMDVAGGSTSPAAFSCGAGGVLTCTAGAPVDCPGVTGNLTAACLYAQQNGFTTTGRQRVTVQAGDQSLSIADPCGQGGVTIYRPPTAGCVDTFYWVTVRTSEQIPQLFSSILGNTLGLVSARATAAVAKNALPGALFLLGRGESWNPSGGPVPDGTNLYLSGSPTLVVPPGINLASAADGPNSQTGWAGYISGGGDVAASMTNIRGGYSISGSGTWTNTPSEGMSENLMFQDPYTGYGQPPITDQVLTLRPVPGGGLSQSFCGGPCPPGNYFATRTVGSTVVATGDPIIVTSDVTFSAGGNAFGDYHFFGGLQIGASEVTFGPGRYVLAGVKNQRTPLLNNDNGATLLSSSPNGSDTGRIFILTDTRYAGLDIQVSAIQSRARLEWPGPIANGAPTLYYSKSSIKAGNNAQSAVRLYGLNELQAGNMPLQSNVAGRQLKDFALAPVTGQGAGILIWQDQGNSYVDYDDLGRVEYGSCTLNSPCMSAYPADPNDSPQFELWASPSADLQGVIYQPRGAWSVVQANGSYTGAIRIISGNMKFQGTGTLTMTGTGPPITTLVTALVE